MEDSNHQPTLSSCAFIGFNDDLFTEILLRLPATSILRFKSVSKHWRWLLSHKSFTLRYDKLLKSPGLFVRNEYVPFDAEDQSPPPFRTLDFCYDPCGIKIIQSCNGLLLCRSNTTERADHNYYVYNPTTKQYAIIPSVPGDDETIFFMGLAFDQTDCVHYKIICIRVLEFHNGLFQIQIYSSSTRHWRISIESFFIEWLFFLNVVYFNKAIHWYSYRHKYVYSFKVDVEQMQTMPFPPPLDDFHDRTHVLYFGESRGRLHLVDGTFTKNHWLHLYVYEMLMDHSGWLLKYQVEFDEISSVFSESEETSWVWYGCCVYDVVRGERGEDMFMVLKFRSKIIKYNVHDKSFELIFNFTLKYHLTSREAYRYIESLASL